MGKAIFSTRLPFEIELDVYLNVALYCTVCVLFVLHMAMKCLFYMKRHLLCTVEINFAFASPWLLIFVTLGWGIA